MHMLEQVQGGAVAAVEQLDIVALDPQRIERAQAQQQGIELGQARGAERALGMQRLAELAQVGAQFGVGVAQQVREHAQRMDGGDGTGREDRHLRLPA